MLTDAQKKELTLIVETSLGRCEELWENTIGKEDTVLRAKFADSETHIPGHPYLGENQYKSDEFVCLMLDMRDSTKHLRQAISARIAKVSQMQRVYYEVSALLPAMAKLIKDADGAVTEYLGDGLLALFQSSRNIDERNQILKNTITAARDCMEALNQVVNPILKDRYGLPFLEIGIGLAYSDAIISHFGLRPDTQLKVIGECIYLASQLSKGRNEIIVHENLERIWPTSKNGKLKFTLRPFKDFKGYVVNA